MIDTLTGISNRFALMEYIKSMKEGNLFLLDIDNFNNINNIYGLEVADEILVEVARLLKISKPNSTELFRLNSDEFVLVSKEFMTKKELATTASSIISFFDNIDISVDDLDIKISFSIGISVGDSKSLLNHAHVAITELRKHKRAAYKIYDQNSTYILKQKENVYWVDKIKSAFMDENITAYFQPIINNKTKKIEKYECLVRIIDDGVTIPPIRFLEASRLTGTLSLVTKQIIEQSFKKFSGTDYEFSINITGTDLHLDYLEEYLLSHVNKYNIKPSRVVLEILEDINNLDDPDIIKQLDSFRENGFNIAIDDFGSENSNFSRLLDFSPDYLKIDGSFIKNILTDNKSLIIVEAIVHICKRSNIKIIAEFVHSKEVQAKIVELGIDYSQGYYFGEPRADID
ncbi:GGDEF domain-containing phosphodiesterase [Sulfurimonas sp.]|nr:GGDEF domain-containing phosphodiesterase [Sulfurimonas sp.]